MGAQKRGIFDNLLEQLGLADVFAQIQSLGQNFINQLVQEGIQTLTLNGDQFKQVLDVFKKLAADLKAQSGDPGTLVQQALDDVAALLISFKEPAQKRGIFDNLLEQLGLADVFAQIQSLGQNFINQLVQEGIQTLTLNGDQLKQVLD